MIDTLDPSGVASWPSRKTAASIDAASHPPEAPPLGVDAFAASILDHSKLTDLETPDDVPTIQNIWRHPSAHPLVLMLLLLDRYGQECVTWDSDVLKMTLERDDIALSNKVWNKIQAARVLVGSPSPWRQWEVFHWVCRGLAGESPNFVYFEEAEIGHLVAGYEMMHAVDPKRETGFEVDKFVAAVFRHEGIAYIPDPLGFATRELEDRKIECRRCGAEHRDDNDTVCVSCGSDQLYRRNYEFAQQRARVDEMFQMRRRLSLDKAVENLGDDGAGNAVYRLLVDWDYAKGIRAQLIAQLRMIAQTRT